MKLLDNFKFKNKLIMIIIIPLLGFLFFSIWGIFDKMSTYKEMVVLEDLSNFSLKISTLVHETQKERGRTAGFLGSKGTKFVNELAKQRSDTDQKIIVINDFINDFKQNNSDGKLNSLLSDAINRLEKIKTKRSEISVLNISTVEAIKYYTDMNSSFLNIIGYLSKLSSDANISGRIFAYYNFLQSKERAGIERAILSNTFAADKFAPGMYEKLISLIAKQDTFLSIFKNAATREDIELCNNALKHNSIKEVERLRNIAINKAVEGNFGIDAGNWFAIITQKINQLKIVDDSLGENLVTETIKLQSSAKSSLILLSTITLFILIITFFLSYNIVKNVLFQIGGDPKEVMNLTKKIANLDISMNFDDEDNITGIYKMMIEMSKNLKKIVSDVKINANDVSLGSKELNDSSESLATGAADQAASITETSTTIEEFTSILKSSSSNSDEANETLMDFNKEVQSKQELIKNVTTTMDEINTSSKKIDEIVSVINDISFQTNLLALNAAVEAARAGEAGRGFAVVASEVRNLAGKTAESSKTIQDIVSNNLEATKRGMELIKQTSDFFNTLFKMTQDIVLKIEQIANGAKEQYTGVEQINIAITQLENVINQNAALVEEFSATSNGLKSNAFDLSELVSKFKIDDSEPKINNSIPNKKKNKVIIPPLKQKKEAKTEENDDFFGADEDGFEEF